MTTRIIRQSEIATFLNCKRQWRLAYQRGLEPQKEKVGAAHLGTLVHAGLEAYYRGRSFRSAICEASGNDVGCTGAADEDVIANVELAAIMVEGYIEWVEETSADAGLEIVAIEKRLEVPFGNIEGDDIVLTCALDMLVRDVRSRLLIVDHKTVQSLEQRGRILAADFQLLTYAVIVMMWEGEQVDGAIHNELRKVKRGARSKPPFYGRTEVNFNRTQLRNHYRHLHSILTEMVRAYQALEAGADHHEVAPPHPTNDCNWRCPFLNVCVMHDDGSDIEAALDFIYRPKEALLSPA